MGFGFLFKVNATMSCEYILTVHHSLTIKRLVRVQVDDQSVFRHKGERKVKTVEEDMEEVTSRTAEVLEEGEELMGGTPEDLHL